MRKMIGTFEVTDNRLIVGDACYAEEENSGRRQDLLLKIPAVNGRWHGYVTHKESKDWGKRVSTLMAIHESKWDQEEIPFSNEGTVGVDSGTVACFSKEFYKSPSNHVFELTIGGDEAGEYDNQIVISSSGYGDGEYQVLTAKDSDTICYAVKIIFIRDGE